MTDFNKLADALESNSRFVRHGVSSHGDAELMLQAARILRAAGAADVAGLMHTADRYALSQSDPAHWRAALESALRVAMAPKGWQPIETAPKEWILLLGYFNESGKWRTVRGEWFCQEEIDDQWEFPENGSPGWYETCVNADEPPNCWPIEPTHWMPLPAAPSQAGAAQEPKP